MKEFSKTIDGEHVMSRLFTALERSCSNAVLVVNRLKQQTGDRQTAEELLADLDEITEAIRDLAEDFTFDRSNQNKGLQDGA